MSMIHIQKFIKIGTIYLPLLIVLLIGSAGQLAADSQNISASDILNQVESMYSTLNSYQDRGLVKSSIQSKEFETYYVGPAFFLFKWIKHMHLYSPKTLKKELSSEYYAVWSNNTGAYSHYRYRSELSDGFEKEKSLGMAVAGATGISSGASHNISSLMIKAVGGFKVTKIENPSLAGEKTVNEKACYYIIGIHPHDNRTKYEIWVDKNNYLIRKIKVTSPLGATETIYMDILTNKNIPVSVFNFEDNIKQVETKTKNISFIEKISLKVDYLLAYLRSRNIEPRGKDFHFSTTTQVKTKDYQNALFESQVSWVIVDPILYEQKFGNEVFAQTRINDILYGAINYSLAFRISEQGVGTEIAEENVDEIISKCNETMRKYKFGIELTELKSKYISISELSDR